MGENDDILSKGEAAEYIGLSVRRLIRLTGKGEVKHLPERWESGPTRYSRAPLDAYLGKLPSVVTAEVTDDTPGTHDVPENNGNSYALMRRPPESVTPITLDTGDILDTPEMRARILLAFEAMASPVRNHRQADALTHGGVPALRLLPRRAARGHRRGQAQGEVRQGAPRVNHQAGRPGRPRAEAVKEGVDK
jgi:hypothetical protein